VEKIPLFMSLFKGRDDVFAKRWEGREGRAGYVPVCLNEWKPGFCGKPEAKCAFCEHRLYAALDEKVIEAHLRGNLVIGIYPLRQDEKCHFLSMDFDKDGWQMLMAGCASLSRPTISLGTRLHGIWFRSGPESTQVHP
jgi:hypothetical protein